MAVDSHPLAREAPGGYSLDFAGIWPVVPTPLLAGEEVDVPALRRIARYLIDRGVAGLWALGAGSEQPNLSTRARHTALEVLMDEVAGAVPVITGVGECSTRAALENARHAERAGASAVHAVEPYYYKLGAQELVEHFLSLADDSALPLVIYHHPDRWPADALLPPGLDRWHARLAEHPNIAGMKDSSLS